MEPVKDESLGLVSVSRPRVLRLSVSDNNFNSPISQSRSRPTKLVSSHYREWRESLSRLGLETKSTETLGLVSDSYIIQRLVSSRSRLGGNILSQSHLGLVSETKYWVSLVSVSSRRLNFYSVSYRSRLALVCLFLKKLCSILGIFVHKLMFFSRSRDKRYRDSRSRTIFRG